MSSKTFAELGVSEPVVAALAQRGIESPFPIQQMVTEDLLAGRDVLAQAPTGSGKTLAFGIPIVELTPPGGDAPRALILVPTRELAEQVQDALWTIARARRLRVTAVYGGVAIPKQAALARRADVIVATPGRLEDLVARGMLRLGQVKLLVLDEADRMLDLGFKPAVDRIVGLLPATRQTAFFSATLEGEAGRLGQRYTNEAVTHIAEAQDTEKPAIEHRFMSVQADTRIDALLPMLGAEDSRALIFVRTRHGAERLARSLSGWGVKCEALHGDKSQAARRKALKEFDTGKVTALVATDVAARGIHVDNVTHVINYDPPATSEDYTHRVGRTGRAGAEGIAVSFVTSATAREVAILVKQLGLQEQFEAAGIDVDLSRGPRKGAPRKSWQGNRPRPVGAAAGGRPRSGGQGDRAQRTRSR